MLLRSKNSNNPYIHNYYWSEAVFPGRVSSPTTVPTLLYHPNGGGPDQSLSAVRGERTFAPRPQHLECPTIVNKFAVDS